MNFKNENLHSHVDTNDLCLKHFALAYRHPLVYLSPFFSQYILFYIFFFFFFVLRSFVCFSIPGFIFGYSPTVRRRWFLFGSSTKLLPTHLLNLCATDNEFPRRCKAIYKSQQFATALGKQKKKQNRTEKQWLHLLRHIVPHSFLSLSLFRSLF